MRNLTEGEQAWAHIKDWLSERVPFEGQYDIPTGSIVLALLSGKTIKMFITTTSDHKPYADIRISD